jgi:hypothetical protein
MIIYKSYFVSAVVFPSEDDSPSLIYPNAVVSCQVAFQQFQSVAWRFTQVVQVISSVERIQFPERHASDRWRESPNTMSVSSVIEVGGGVISKRKYHLSFTAYSF